MKILRIFGIVAAVHFFAFVFIMANPGCSTKSKNANPGASGEPMAATAEDARPDSSSPFAPMPAAKSSGESAGISFDPNAIAGASRSSPTRPNSAAANTPQAEVSETAASVPATVTVGKGDSLWSLSKKAGVPVSEFAAANNLRTDAVLAVGTKLVVPGKTVPAPKSASSTKLTNTTPAAHAKTGVVEPAPAKAVGKAGTVIHIVKPGEMLGSIARKYGVKAADIAVANNITNPAMIPSGRELIIPMPKAKSSSATGSGPASSKSSKSPAASQAVPAASEPVSKASAEQTQPAPSRNTRPIMPIIGNPSPVQDLDAGLPAASRNNVPVIKIEDDNAPSQ